MARGPAESVIALRGILKPCQSCSGLQLRQTVAYNIASVPHPPTACSAVAPLASALGSRARGVAGWSLVRERVGISALAHLNQSRFHSHLSDNSPYLVSILITHRIHFTSDSSKAFSLDAGRVIISVVQ